MKKLPGNRRQFISTSLAGAAALTTNVAGVSGSAEQPRKRKYPLRISVSCAALNQRAQVKAIEIGYRIGLDGVSVRYLTDKSEPNSLRNKSVQLAYRAACLQYGIQINSLMVGGALKTSASSVVPIMESIQCARNLGAGVILLGLLRNNFPATDEEYDRIISVLKELAPYAAEDGIVLGLECSGSAEEQLRIIQGVDHRAVLIYYDVYNAMYFGHDPLREIPILGDVICEYHIKNGRQRMRINIEGKKHPSIQGEVIRNFNHPAIAATIRKTGFRGWLTIESPIFSDDPVADVADNVAYMRDVYR